MLFEAERHEALHHLPWDPPRAQAWITHIVQGTEASGDLGRGWPLHPRDVAPDDDPHLAATPLYHGAAGVAWALRHLASLGAC